MRKVTYVITILWIYLLSACQSNSAEQQAMDRAERLIQSNPDSAFIMLEQIIPTNKSEEYYTWAALKAWASYRTYQSEINEEELQAAFNYFAQRDIKHRKALVYYLRAVLHEDKKIGNEADWMEDLRRGCMEVENTDAHFLAAHLFHRYGIGLQKRNRLDDASVYLNKYLARAEQAHSHSDQIIALINLSNLSLEQYRAEGAYSEAIAFAQKAVEKARNWQLNNELGKALGQLSICCGHNKQYDEALQYAIQAKNIDEQQHKAGIRKEQVRYVRIADAHRKLGNADSALHYAEKNLHHPELSTRMNGVQLLYMIHRDLLQDYQKSTHYMQMFQQMKDSLAQQLQNEQVLRREMSSENAEALKKQKQEYNYMLLSVICIALLLISLIIIYRKQLKRQKYLLNENEVVIHEQQAHEQMLTKEIINNHELIRNLHETPHFISQDSWDELFAISEKVYPEFLSTLRNNFPDLTDVDVQVALLIKLHFSGTQIATMMAISPSSVTKQKQRMKKRLTKSNSPLFQAEMSLDSFICSL